MPSSSQAAQVPQTSQLVPRAMVSANEGHDNPTTSGQAQQEGFLRSLLGSRSRSPTPPSAPHPQQAPESPVIDMLAKSIQQLQSLQAQALTKSGATEELSKLSPRGGCEAALQFQDWLEVAGSVLSDVSEQSGQWWRELMMMVELTYSKWLAATPLERLHIAPHGSEELTTGRWTRLNARISSMLLSAMGDNLKSDMVSQRLTQDAVRMVFRMFTTYQPGGSAERQDILRRLQSPQEYVTVDTAEVALSALRAWPRWLARCRAVNMACPDPSVLARGLMSISAKHINQSPDAAFRTSMLRTSLRIDAQPSLEQVVGYQRHLQAELETIAGASTTSTTTTPGVRALEKGGSPKGREKGGKDTELCRYFMKPSGCKRGARCAYSHSMATLDRETRSKKCLQCGAEGHRARECPVSKGPKSAASPGSPTKEQRSGGQPEPKATPKTPAVATATPIAEGPTQGTPWTLESLVQAAQQIVQAQGQEGREDKSPEKTRPEVKTLVAKDIRISSLHSASSALLDSGATHNLRSAYDQQEWEKADNVVVQLAGSNKLTMKMSETGTLLMPPKATSLGSSEAATGGQTIVSMGELERTLGYTLVWAPERCVLQTPQGDEVQLSVHGGCPQLCEAEALAIIARLEERKRERLLNEVTTTQDRIEMAAVAMDRGGMDHLRDYVEGGSLEAGLRSIRDVGFLQGLPGECVDGLLQPGVREQGWGVMKNLSFLTRAQKRYLWGAKRWVIHLFAGDYGHYKVFQLDQGSTAVIELDVHRCKGHDIPSESTWRFLLWGALTGRIDAVIGGPPARSGVTQPTGKNGPEVLRAMKLITRMMWLFTLAKMTREYRTDALNRQRPVAFLMEHPATDSRRRTSVWETELWREFKNEMDMMEVTFNQRATGGGDVPTTIGTNVYYLLGLDNLGQENLEGEVGVSKDGGIWSSGLVDAIVLALTFWDKHPRCCPVLAPMSPEQWRRHIQSNHADYHRDCLTCVMARGTGRRHARVRHPDMFNLTVGLAGPVRPGLDPTSKGTMGKGLKYMMVAKYVFPKEYVKGYTGREPPGDHGMGEKEDVGDPGQQLEAGNNGQGEPPTLQSSDEQILEDLKRIPLPSEEEQGGNPTRHPLRDEDPFELDSVEQLEEEEEFLHSQEPPGRDEGFVGSTIQRGDYTGPEDFAYEPSLQEEEEQQPQLDLEKDDDEPLQEERCHDNGFPDSCAPEATHLIFARALPTNGSGVVKAAIQDIVLYLQARGLMVYRLHADMGEVYCHQIRGWLRDQGIRATFSEPSKPQQNGLAEATVRWVKTRRGPFC